MAETDQKKQQMEYIAVGALVLIALFIGISRFKKKDKEDEIFSRKEFNERWEEIEILEKKVPQKEKGVSYTVYSKRVPFKSPFEEREKEMKGKKITLPEMSFQGMIWSSLKPQAIIDNKVYGIGDLIVIGEGDMQEEVLVKHIDKEGIHLWYKGREFLVRPK